MLAASPCRKPPTRSDVSSYGSPMDRSLLDSEKYRGRMNAHHYSPKTPIAFMADRVDVCQSAKRQLTEEGSLGKRHRFESPICKKENQEAPIGSSAKNRQQKLQELDERYRMMSQKLSGGKFTTPNPKEMMITIDSKDDDIEMIPMSTPVKTDRVLTYQDQNITPTKTPETPESVKRSEKRHIISIDLDETNNASTEIKIPKFEIDPDTKLSYRAYAARTNNGLFRNYNEDRVSIIQKIFVDNNQQDPTSFFALFDGHSGPKVADYLRDNMHQHITKSKAFRSDKRQALRQGIIEAENKCLEISRQTNDHSGSCALVCMLESDRCLVANVGDSRVVVGKCKGKLAEQITVDHKPEAIQEKARIFANGGSVFRSKKCTMRELTDASGKITDVIETVRYGPFRVEPGGLSVSRTIGDLPAKDDTRKGNSRCIIAEPDIFDFELTTDHDFMVLACDGVFDVVSTEEVVNTCWKSISENARLHGIKESCRLAAESIMKLSFDKRSMDNITVIVIAFQNEKYYC